MENKHPPDTQPLRPPIQLLMGLPRSGTTLACRILNETPDLVALNEPMNFEGFDAQSSGAPFETISSFAHACRRQIEADGTAPSLQVEGRIPDNNFESHHSAQPLRTQLARRGCIGISKPLPGDWALVIKHNVAFAALLDTWDDRMPCVAMVRNPLALLASWSTIDSPLAMGRSPLGERLNPSLKAWLSGVDDTIDRQIRLMDWFFGQFLRHLPPDRILRYEDVVSSGGARLAEAFESPLGRGLDWVIPDMPLARDPAWLRQTALALLRQGGQFLSFYTQDDILRLSEVNRAS